MKKGITFVKTVAQISGLVFSFIFHSEHWVGLLFILAVLKILVSSTDDSGAEEPTSRNSLIENFLFYYYTVLPKVVL